MRVVHIKPGLLVDAWRLVEPWVEKAVEKAQSDESVAAIRWDVLSGTMELILVWDDEARKAVGCCILEFTDTQRGKLCNIYLCAGQQFRRWRHLMADIKAHARANGCTLLQAGGRPGWERLLAPDGFRRLRVILEARLDNAE